MLEKHLLRQSILRFSFFPASQRLFNRSHGRKSSRKNWTEIEACASERTLDRHYCAARIVPAARAIVLRCFPTQVRLHRRRPTGSRLWTFAIAAEQKQCPLRTYIRSSDFACAKNERANRERAREVHAGVYASEEMMSIKYKGHIPY